jgi:hypothetical protein
MAGEARIMASVTLILSGIAMLAAAGGLLYLLRPREGKPVFFLARSDSGSALLVIGLMSLALFGIGLVVKGLTP